MGGRGATFCFRPFWICSRTETALFTFGCKPWVSNLYACLLRRYGEETPMGIIRPIDRRSETRTVANSSVTVWGVDTHGERFLQEARVRDISISGALLSGLEVE